MPLGGWGKCRAGYIEPQALAEYERCFCRAESIHHASARITAPAPALTWTTTAKPCPRRQTGLRPLVLSGRAGVVHKPFDPLALWQAQCAGRVTGQALPAGTSSPRTAGRDGAGAANLPCLQGTAMLAWLDPSTCAGDRAGALRACLLLCAGPVQPSPGWRFNTGRAGWLL